MRRFIRFTVAVFGILTLAGGAKAEYPDRPIRLIVPFEPGAGADLLARTLGHKLSVVLGQQIVVVNRSGASGNIGSESVARAAPDGYTLLLFNNSQTLNAALNPKLSYDAVQDFTGIAMLATSPILLVASRKFQVTTVKDLVALAKKDPGKINYGSAGYGTPLHFAGELLNLMADIKLAHVPYRGQGASSAALIANDIELGFGTVAGFAPLIKEGFVHPIAAAGAKRMKELPDLPTIAENGYPTFDVFIWYGLVTPAKTPPEIVNQLYAAVVKILNEPADRADFEQKGYEVTPSTPEKLNDFIKSDVTRWKNLVQKANLAPPN